MRHLVELPDEASAVVAGAVAQATQNLETELQTVTVPNLIMGIQHQLGMIAALSMAGISENAEDIADHLLAVAGLSSIYLKALKNIHQEETTDETEPRQQDS